MICCICIEVTIMIETYFLEIELRSFSCNYIYNCQEKEKEREKQNLFELSNSRFSQFRSTVFSRICINRISFSIFYHKNTKIILYYYCIPFEKVRMVKGNSVHNSINFYYVEGILGMEKMWLLARLINLLLICMKYCKLHCCFKI